jgi:hypothetical protein
VLDAQLCGDRPTESDKTLYPSDHIGLKVRLRITPRSNKTTSSDAGGSSMVSNQRQQEPKLRGIDGSSGLS